jgi:large subunit ribosomal protein L23
MDKTIALRPHLSEKTYGLSESRVYVLEVPADINKHRVARAVEAQFEVKVDKVNIANIRGKTKRTMSVTGKRVKNAEGRRSDARKAYVTLAEGHSLPFFNAIEEEEQKEQALQAKVDKAATKQAGKTAKKTADKTEAEPPAEEQPKPRRGWRLPKRVRLPRKEGKS